MHRASFRGLGLALLLLLGMLVVPPAQAHDYLVSSSPDQGATIDSPPGQVSLEFNTSIGQQFAQVAVVGPDGATYQQRDPVVDGATVTQAVAPIPAGESVTISYRVVSSDGHPIGGTVAFTVAEQAGGTSPDDAAASSGPTPTAQPTGTAQATPTPIDAVEPASATNDSTDGDTSLLPWLLAIFAASAAIAGAVTFVLVRRRRHPAHPTQQQST